MSNQEHWSDRLKAQLIGVAVDAGVIIGQRRAVKQCAKFEPNLVRVQSAIHAAITDLCILGKDGIPSALHSLNIGYDIVSKMVEGKK